MTGPGARREWPLAFILVGVLLAAFHFARTDTFYLTARAAAGPPAGAAGAAGADLPPDFPGLPVNINTAEVDALTVLPGIGPVTAARIIEKRMELGGFSSVEELKTVRWINEARVSALRGLVTVE